ncbi:PAS domain S-box protein [Mucilaginibacter sp.]
MSKIITDTENSFKVLFYHNPQPMWIVEVDTLKFFAVNDAAIRHYGYSRSEFLSITLAKIRPPKEHGEMIELINKIKDRQSVKKELTHVKKNGDIILVNITSYTVNYQGHECRMVIINDVTRQSVVNGKLQTAWAKLRQTLETMTDGFITLNKKLQFTYINKEALRILSTKKNISLNKNIFDVFPEIENTRFAEFIRKALVDPKSERFEQYLSTPDKWICPTIYPNSSGMGIYITDITLEKKSQMLNQAHTKTLEELAYLNSHVIRKEVANIVGIIQLMEHLDDKEKITELMPILNKSAKNLDNIIKEINTKIEN